MNGRGEEIRTPNLSHIPLLPPTRRWQSFSHVELSPRTEAEVCALALLLELDLARVCDCSTKIELHPVTIFNGLHILFSGMYTSCLIGTYSFFESNCQPRTTFPMGTRLISTPWLNTSLYFHRVPINLIISQGT